MSVKKQLYTMQQKEKATPAIISGYALSRAWFDFAFENRGQVKPIHGALYFWVIELSNRMGWPKEFANPASQCMAACGISSYNTYKKAFEELQEFGFITLIKPSVNQWQSCIIALSKFNNPLYNALDKSLSEHYTNHLQSTVQITDSINKPQTTNHKPKTINYSFDVFWDAYKKKEGKKAKCKTLWDALTNEERQTVIDGLPNYLKQFEAKGKEDFHPYPQTFLNGRYWENDSFTKSQTTTGKPNNVQPSTSLSREEFLALMQK